MDISTSTHKHACMHVSTKMHSHAHACTYVYEAGKHSEYADKYGELKEVLFIEGY